MWTERTSKMSPRRWRPDSHSSPAVGIGSLVMPHLSISVTARTHARSPEICRFGISVSIWNCQTHALSRGVGSPILRRSLDFSERCTARAAGVLSSVLRTPRPASPRICSMSRQNRRIWAGYELSLGLEMYSKRQAKVLEAKAGTRSWGLLNALGSPGLSTKVIAASWLHGL